MLQNLTTICNLLKWYCVYKPNLKNVLLWIASLSYNIQPFQEDYDLFFQILQQWSHTNRWLIDLRQHVTNINTSTLFLRLGQYLKNTSIRQRTEFYFFFGAWIFFCQNVKFLFVSLYYINIFRWKLNNSIFINLSFLNASLQPTLISFECVYLLLH